MFLSSGILDIQGESVLYWANLPRALNDVWHSWAPNVRSFPVTENIQTMALLEKGPGEGVACLGKTSLLHEQSQKMKAWPWTGIERSQLYSELAVGPWSCHTTACTMGTITMQPSTESTGPGPQYTLSI